MKPLSETPRFPILNFVLCVAFSIIFGFSVVYLALWIWSSSPSYPSNPITALAIYSILGPVVLVTAAGACYFLARFAINHLSGRYVIGDDNASSRDVFADTYSISTHYVLPYAYNGINKQNDPYCELYLSFSYTEIFDAYQSLKKHHRLVYYFRTLSLPNHLGRRRPLLTRAGAKRLLQEMTARATANGEDIRLQRAILCYTFFPSYSPKIALPEHQTFISRDVIRDLLYLINPDRNQPLPNGAEITASYDAGRAVVLNATYLCSIFSRIAAEDELVYLPIQE